MTVVISLAAGGGQRGRRGRLESPAKRQQSRVVRAANHCVRHLVNGLIVESEREVEALAARDPADPPLDMFLAGAHTSTPIHRLRCTMSNELRCPTAGGLCAIMPTGAPEARKREKAEG